MKHALACLAVLLLASCAGKPVRPPATYLLRGAVADGVTRTEGPARVGLGRVGVAPYLQSAGVAFETAPGRIRAARQHQWAEPLEAGLRAYLRAALSAALGEEVGDDAADRPQWRHRVDLQVDRLHGTAAGNAVLEATFRIVHADQRPATSVRFTRSAALESPGYPALVATERALLDELAAAIAAALPAP